MCGPGEAKLAVSCVRPEAGRDVEVEQSFCSQQIKPPDSVPCVVDVCPIGWESKGEVKLKMTLTLLSKCESCINAAFPGQEQSMLEPSLLPRSRQAPVYVWSPAISQCSKTCGNGKGKICTPLNLKTSLIRNSMSTSDMANQSLVLAQEHCRCGFPVWTTRPDWGCLTSTAMLLPNLLLRLRSVAHLPAVPCEIPKSPTLLVVCSIPKK